MSWLDCLDYFDDDEFSGRKGRSRYPTREARSAEEAESAKRISSEMVDSSSSQEGEKAKITIDIRGTDWIQCGKKIGATGCYMFVELKVRHRKTLFLKPQVDTGKTFKNTLFDSYCWKEIKSSSNKGFKLEFCVDLYRNQGITSSGKIRVITTGDHFIPLRGSHCEIKITIIKDPRSSFDDKSKALEEVFQAEPRLDLDLTPHPPELHYPSHPSKPYKKTASMPSCYSNGRYPSTFGELVSSLKARRLGPDSLYTASAITNHGTCLVCNLHLGNSSGVCHNIHAKGSKHRDKARGLERTWDNYQPALSHNQRQAEMQRQQREYDLTYAQQLKEYEEAMKNKDVLLAKYKEDKEVRDGQVKMIEKENEKKIAEAFQQWEQEIRDRPEILRIAAATCAGVETRGKRSREDEEQEEEKENNSASQLAPQSTLTTTQVSSSYSQGTALQPSSPSFTNSQSGGISSTACSSSATGAAKRKLINVDFKSLPSGEIAISGKGTFNIKDTIKSTFSFSWNNPMKAWVVSRKVHYGDGSDDVATGPLTVAEARSILEQNCEK